MILYHYTTGQGVFGIINSKQLHCSNVMFLNDPSEQKYSNEILEVVLSKCSLCKKIYDTFYNESYHDVILNQTDKFIASFSKNRDSLSMWNYYSKGNGYNIGFEIDAIIKNNHGNKVYIKKVELIYDKNEQLKRTTNFILSFKDKLKRYHELNALSEHDYYKYEQETNWLIEEFNDGIYDLMITFKHEAYENEEEIRLIVNPDSFQREPTEYKISNNGVFIEFVGLNLNPKEDIKSITIHPLNEDIHLQSTKHFLYSRVGYNQIEVNKSEIPFRLV